MPIGDIRFELVPSRLGLRTDIPKHLVPDGFVVAGQNVIFRDGRTLTRPGMTTLSTAPTSNRAMGVMYYKDFAGVQRTILATTAGFHLFNGSSWSDITGSTVLTGSSSNQVRFAVLPFANSTRVIAVNDKDVPQVYNGTGTFADLGGSPPVAKSVTVAFQRAILANVTVSGTRRSSALWVSGFQDPTIWAASSEVNLTDTDDQIVDVRSLNNQMFAIYKERSQWVGIGSGGLFPFIYEIRAQQPGPVSPRSVVVAEADHYYVGVDGDVYKFDGSRCLSIGGAVKRTIQSDLDFANQGQTHGFYDEINREIWWFWPTTQLVSSGFAGISYRLPYGDVPGAFSTLHVFGVAVTASTRWTDHSTVAGSWNDLGAYTWDNIATTFPTWDSFSAQGRPANLLAGSDGNVYRFGAYAGDAGAAFDAYWQTPFRPMAGLGQNVQIHKIESFFKEALASINVDIYLVKSDTMDDDGELAAAQTVDISSISSSAKVRATYENQLARFVAVRHRLTMATGLQEYRGGVMYGYSRGEY